MQRSKFDIRGADAGAGGMSISSGSGPSGMGASSSSSDASATAHSTGSSGAGSGSMCLETSSSWAWSAAASATASRNSALLPARKPCHPVVHALFSPHKSVAARDAHKANFSLPRNVFCVRIEQGLPPRSDAHDAEAIELPQKTSDPK